MDLGRNGTQRGNVRPRLIGALAVLAAAICLGAWLWNWQPESALIGAEAAPTTNATAHATTNSPTNTTANAMKWPEAPAGQLAVPVGKGSYADRPTPQSDPKMKAFDRRPLNLVHEDDRPIPTNQWWTDLLVSKYAALALGFPAQGRHRRQGHRHLLSHALGRRGE